MSISKGAATTLLLRVLMLLALWLPTGLVWAAPLSAKKNKEINSLFQEANTLYTQGFMDQAQRAYLECLKAANGQHPDALTNLASLLVDINEPEEAMRQYDKALQQAPGHKEALFNAALLHHDLANNERAESLYKTLIEIDSRHLGAVSNLASLMHSQNKLSHAVSLYEKAISMALETDRQNKLGADDLPDLLGSLYEHLGRAQLRMLDISKAQADKSDARRLSDDKERQTQTLTNLHDTAIHSLREAYRRVPSNAIVKHLLVSNGAVLEGQGREEKQKGAPAEYVKQLFDSYSSNFENSLEQLNYNVPELMVDVVAAFSLESGVSFGAVIDLGCGTGLLAKVMLAEPRLKTTHFDNNREAAGKAIFIGVDLSSGMLAKAEPKQLYEHLYSGDVLEFLHLFKEHLIMRQCVAPPPSGAGHRRKLSGSIIKNLEDMPGLDSTFRVRPEHLIAEAHESRHVQGVTTAHRKTRILYAAADVLVYLGDLVPLFSVLDGMLRPDDVFVFTVEALEQEEEEENAGWVLQRSGRYAHSKQYIEALAGKFPAMKIDSLTEVTLRSELSQDIRGYLVLVNGV